MASSHGFHRASPSTAARPASSLRCFDGGDAPQRILVGAIERSGDPQATLKTKGRDPANEVSQALSAPDHAAAVDVLLDWIDQHLGGDGLTAVGHRIVQGGPNHSAPHASANPIAAMLAGQSCEHLSSGAVLSRINPLARLASHSK